MNDAEPSKPKGTHMHQDYCEDHGAHAGRCPDCANEQR